MVRTRADNTARRAVAAKAPRKALASSSPSATPGGIGKDKYCGGNPVRWAPTPSWQKGIDSFFGKSNCTKDSSSQPNVIPDDNDEVDNYGRKLEEKIPENTEESATTSNNYNNTNVTDNNCNIEEDIVSENQEQS